MSKEAYARLEETNRTCDACGERIGRWTSKCFFDPAHNRVYCSTSGCAELAQDVPPCTGCGKILNTFFPEDFTRTHVQGHPATVCTACIASNKEVKLPHPKLDLEKVQGVSRGDKEDAALGPYVVLKAGPSWYQVVMPLAEGKVSVRATGADASVAVMRCAAFNRDDYVPGSLKDPDTVVYQVEEPTHDVKVTKQEPWLYIESKKMDEDVPTSWTRDKKGRIKTRMGTNRADQIIKWFAERGVNLEEIL